MNNKIIKNPTANNLNPDIFKFLVQENITTREDITFFVAIKNIIAKVVQNKRICIKIKAILNRIEKDEN